MFPFPKNFLSALKEKDCLLFLGSGISQWAGLPSWSELVQNLVGFLDDHGLAPDEKTEIESFVHRGELITAASLCSMRMRGADLREFIDAHFVTPNPKPHRAHEIIASLGPDSFVTTNYDRLIDDAFRDVRGANLTCVNNNQPIEQAGIEKHNASKFIFAIHGRADNVETVVLSLQDYRRLSENLQRVNVTLEHLLVSRPVVYLGYGLNDPDFLMIKDAIGRTYHGGEREHFAVMPDVGPVTKEFWRKHYGINIISYDTRESASPGDAHAVQRHEMFLRLLENLKTQMASGGAASVDLQLRKDTSTQWMMARNAVVRFCEDVVNSYGASGEDNIGILAEFRADLSRRNERGERAPTYPRFQTTSELFDRAQNLYLMGPAGSGKSYAIQAYSVVLAQRALANLGNEQVGPAIRGSVPLILRMKEYSGDLEEMIQDRIPRSIDKAWALSLGLFAIFFDGLNEVSRRFGDSRQLMHQISSLFDKYPLNRFILSSRTIDAGPVHSMPVFELRPIGRKDLADYLGSTGIDMEILPSSLQDILRNPLLLSLYLKLKITGVADVVDMVSLVRLHLQSIENHAQPKIGKEVSILRLLRPIAYQLVSNGSQSMQSSDFERELGRILHEERTPPRVAPIEVVNSLVLLGLLVPDYEKRLGFFHQTVLEYLAAAELASKYERDPFSLKHQLSLTRWDETIILFATILPPKQSTQVLHEIAETDLVFACHAFDSATRKEAAIGRFLFDQVTQTLSRKTYPESEKRRLAYAVNSLAPFGKEDILIKWLDDPIMAGSAAKFLARMNVKKVIPKLIDKLVKDNTYPSDFARALEIMRDGSVVPELLRRGRLVKITKSGSLVPDNIAEVIEHYESDSLYLEIEKLSKSQVASHRIFAADLLSYLESKRSKEMLTTLLDDADSSVQSEAILGLEGLFGGHSYKTPEIVSRMFELLSDKNIGSSAAYYLQNQKDKAIVDESLRRIETPRNVYELLNVCNILADEIPERVTDLLVERLKKYKPAFHEPLYSALQRLPPDVALPAILPYLRSGDDKLLQTILEALRHFRPKETSKIAIDEADCEFAIGLWERLRSYDKSLVENVLSGPFGRVSKPILLERLADSSYRFRDGLLSIISVLELKPGDLSSSTLDWVLGKLDITEHGWSPAASILGKAADESFVVSKVIPLCLSSNASVRSNACQAVRIAERSLGKRFVEGNAMQSES